jgi:hypothetical protein
MPEGAGVLPAIAGAPATGPGGGIGSSTPRLRAGDAEDEGVALAAAAAQRGGADSPCRAGAVPGEGEVEPAPLMQAGWPRAMPPPLTLTRSGDTPSPASRRARLRRMRR